MAKLKVEPCPLCGARDALRVGHQSIDSEGVACGPCGLSVVEEYPKDDPQGMPAGLSEARACRWIERHCLDKAVARWNRLPRLGFRYFEYRSGMRTWPDLKGKTPGGRERVWEFAVIPYPGMADRQCALLRVRSYQPGKDTYASCMSRHYGRDVGGRTPLEFATAEAERLWLKKAGEGFAP